MKNKEFIILVLEYFTTFTLFDYIQKFEKKILPINELINILSKICEAIIYIHNKNFNHGDIKLENILIENDNNIKLIDFGFSSNLIFNKYVSYYWGTPHYMSPEILKQSPYIGKKVDLWAMGVLLYKLFTGVFIFNGKNNDEIFNKIKTFDSNLFLNKQFKSIEKNYVFDLIIKLLKKEPEERLVGYEIIKHKWFSLI